MACRVGITTDLARRRREHESDFKNVRNWESSGPYANRETAQAKEDQLKRERGCEGHGGGDDPDDPNAKWSAYYFQHDGRK